MGYYDNYNTSGQGGNVSEWNEGNLKNLRLHQAQELINYSKITPLRKSFDNYNWNYNLWIEGITILYTEGYSKYRDEEIEEIEKIIQLIRNKLIISPIISKIVICSLGSKRVKENINFKNWEELRKLIEIFEQKVKYFNDVHGLSTRNVDDDDGL